MHVFGQLLLCGGVWYVVTDVRDVRLARLDFCDDVKCLWQNEMRWMNAFFAQGVHHKYFGVFDYFQRLLRHARRIGDVCEIAYPISRYHHLRVHYWKRRYLHPKHLKRLVIFQFVEHDVGYARIFRVGKTIREVVPDGVAGIIGGIDGYVLLLYEAERPDVVQSREMVAVRMSYQQCVYVPHVVGEALLPEVGTRVNDDAAPLDLHECAAPQTLVVSVGGLADGAVAAYNWYAERRACTQKCYFHNIVKQLNVLFCNL